jgi:hypothetical protein
MNQQYNKAALDLATVAAAQAFDLLRYIGGIDRGELARAQQARLLGGPGIEIFLIVGGVAGHRRASKLFPITLTEG